MNTTTAAENVDTTAPATPDTTDSPSASVSSPASAQDESAGEAPGAELPAAAAATAGAAPAPAPAQSARALLKQLQQEFPAFRDCLPLAIGIDKQLLARMPDLNRKIMRAALGIHTGSMRYLRAMEKAKLRYDLDGTPGAEVTDTHRQHAKEQLQERFKKEAERKKAERAAAAAEEADRQRQDKLNALAAKFSRN